MDKLTPHAEALIASLAHDHGVGRLEPDADGLIVIDFDGEIRRPRFLGKLERGVPYRRPGA